jgi:hypothetical protein
MAMTAFGYDWLRLAFVKIEIVINRIVNKIRLIPKNQPDLEI